MILLCSLDNCQLQLVSFTDEWDRELWIMLMIIIFLILFTISVDLERKIWNQNINCKYHLTVSNYFILKCFLGNKLEGKEAQWEWEGDNKGGKGWIWSKYVLYTYMCIWKYHNEIHYYVLLIMLIKVKNKMFLSKFSFIQEFTDYSSHKFQDQIITIKYYYISHTSQGGK